jgi:hypothetical protein
MDRTGCFFLYKKKQIPLMPLKTAFPLVLRRGIQILSAGGASAGDAAQQ